MIPCEHIFTEVRALWEAELAKHGFVFELLDLEPYLFEEHRTSDMYRTEEGETTSYFMRISRGHQ